MGPIKIEPAKAFEEVLTTFSRADTLTTSLQDWRKGRRAEIEEVNGYAIAILHKFGKAAPDRRALRRRDLPRRLRKQA